jgi:hypothetical protein
MIPKRFLISMMPLGTELSFKVGWYMHVELQHPHVMVYCPTYNMPGSGSVELVEEITTSGTQRTYLYLLLKTTHRAVAEDKFI